MSERLLQTLRNTGAVSTDIRVPQVQGATTQHGAPTSADDEKGPYLFVTRAPHSGPREGEVRASSLSRAFKDVEVGRRCPHGYHSVCHRWLSYRDGPVVVVFSAIALIGQAQPSASA
jgi:hypothetical protein